MTSIFLNSDSSAGISLERASLAAGESESWLQSLIHDHPSLLPMEEIDPGSGTMIPLARELGLPSPSGRVFLDLLGVTPRGRLVLVECKLWRNPEARREVVAQILEYAALLRRWSYADLTAYLKSHRGYSGGNPIYERAAASGTRLEEAAFTDAVSRSLRLGDFDLIIAGDGIREDTAAIAGHLQGQGARFALVEFQTWSGPGGERLVVPSIPFRSEVHRQTILVAPDGAPLETGEDFEAEGATGSNADTSGKRAANRAFWQRYIDAARFDHPDQPVPRHGADNWVKLPLPGGTRLTAFRNGNGHMGFFLPPLDGGRVYEILARDAEGLRTDTGLPELRFHQFNDPDIRDTIGLEVELESFPDEQAQLDWLKDIGNRLVSAIRPRLSELEG